MFKPEEQELITEYPSLPWTEPLPVHLLGGNASGLGCRFCIALSGLFGGDVANLCQTREEFDAHMQEHSMPQ